MNDARRAVLMTEIASSDRLWTRAAVRRGRIFVCFPRWFADEHMRMSVGELVSPGRVEPFPDKEKWNSWTLQGPLKDENFICVQSVYFDDGGKLWVLDTDNPVDPDTWKHSGIIGTGPKLYKFDVGTRKCDRTFNFSKSSYRHDSYFNDVRVCTERKKAFITDSGAGALVVLDLNSGDNWRLLDSEEEAIPR
jgi:major royal jelly protein